MDEVTNHIEIHMPPPPLPHSLLSLLSLLPLPPFSPLISLLHSSLVYRWVGRMKEVRNQAAGKGSSYYQSLLLDSKSNVCVCCMVIACYEESHLLSFPSSPTLPSLCSLLCLLPSLLPLPPPPFPQSQWEKQIKLDLYRTLPSNRHFKMGGAGVSSHTRRIVCTATDAPAHTQHYLPCDCLITSHDH